MKIKNIKTAFKDFFLKIPRVDLRQHGGRLKQFITKVVNISQCVSIYYSYYLKKVRLTHMDQESCHCEIIMLLYLNLVAYE